MHGTDPGRTQYTVSRNPDTQNCKTVILSVGLLNFVSISFKGPTDRHMENVSLAQQSQKNSIRDAFKKNIFNPFRLGGFRLSESLGGGPSSPPNDFCPKNDFWEKFLGI